MSVEERVIEIVSEERCTGCDRCVRICPTDVFDAVPGGAPVIARPDACQTRFMCELYCPVDALYVAPDADTHPEITEADVDACTLEPVGQQLRVRVPVKLAERLRTARGEPLKNDSWLLAGTGRFRTAAQLEVTE